jgi:hypothetical protein
MKKFMRNIGGAVKMLPAGGVKRNDTYRQAISYPDTARRQEQCLDRQKEAGR